MTTKYPQTFKEQIFLLRQDAVIWKSTKIWGLSAGDPDCQQRAIDDITAMLLCIRQHVKRDNYTDLITRALKLKSKWLKDSIINALSIEEDKLLTGETNAKLPPWVKRDRIINYGFDWQQEGEHTGYWFAGQNGILTQLTNFVLTPLFHIYDKTGGNRRLTQVQNGYGLHKTVELPSKAWISLDRFQETLMDEGYLHTNDGFTVSHLRRLFRAIGNEYPKTYELKVLGWEPEGFWSYSNAIFDGSEIIRFNDIGIAEHKKTYYYSPSASGLYKSDRKDDDGKEVNDDDPYENDKHLHYLVSPVTFSQWSHHMVKMHKQAAMPLVAYAIVSLFKDIITSYEKIPLLYGYGLVQSGKSVWAECLYYLFHARASKPFNLNQGTLYAFFNRMERFRNVPELFNEFDEDAIAEEFFRAFKAFYDGEGRDRGKGIKGKTETQKINCSVIIVGQTLTTKDGASVLIRSVPVRFNDPGERTEEESDNYQTWNAWANTGMNSCLTEVLRYRKAFKEQFAQTFNEQLNRLKTAIKDKGESFKERIAKNYCILLASTRVIGKYIPLGFTDDEMFEYCRQNIISLSRMISEVDNLALFWNIVEFLQEMGMIQEGVDFKLETETSIKKKMENEIVEVPFDGPSTILYIRLTKVFPLFQEQFRKTNGGKNAINQGTLLTYFDSSKPYLGKNNSSRFADKVTNSYMFDYAKLKINLEKSDPLADDRKPVTLTADVIRPAELKEIKGMATMIIFTVKHFDQVPVQGATLPKTVEVVTVCNSTQTSLQADIVTGARVKLTGLLTETKHKEFRKRSLDVSTVEVLGAIRASNEEFDHNSSPVKEEF